MRAHRPLVEPHRGAASLRRPARSGRRRTSRGSTARSRAASRRSGRSPRVWRRSRSRPPGTAQPGTAHEHAADRAAQERQRAAQGDDQREVGVGKDQRDHQDEVDRRPPRSPPPRPLGNIRSARSRSSWMLAAMPIAVTAPRPMPPARASRASPPSSTVAASTSATSAISRPVDHAHQRVQPLRPRRTRSRAPRGRSPPPSRARPRSPRCCGARAGSRPARRPGRRRRARRRVEPPRQQRDDHEQREQARGLRELLEERAGREQSRLAGATHARHLTEGSGEPGGTASASGRRGYTSRPRYDPATAASTGGSQRARRCRRRYPRARSSASRSR